MINKISFSLYRYCKIDMKVKPSSVFIQVGSFIVSSRRFLCFTETPICDSRILFCTLKTATYSTISPIQVDNVLEEGVEQPVKVLRRFGCSDGDIAKMFSRLPSLRSADLSRLQFKLSLLQGLGMTSNDLAKIISCRPRFLTMHINHCFDECLEYLLTLFGSREMLVKAIIRNPSLLTYDVHRTIKPVIALYERLGVSKKDLIHMLVSRPMLIPRTKFDDEKIDYVYKTGVSKDSKMYKHVVSIIAITRMETICEKMANFQKFGISSEEFWSLFGRSPYLLTLSAEKVQRNMTYIVGTMKLSAKVILKYPFLLYNNLETVIKPRVLLAGKIDDMDLCPTIKGPVMFRALRMTEKRFLKAFVNIHADDVAKELMDFYINTKGVKRLAETSKRTVYKGFPF